MPECLNEITREDFIELCEKYGFVAACTGAFFPEAIEWVRPEDPWTGGEVTEADIWGKFA